MAERAVHLSGIATQSLGTDSAGRSYWKFPLCGEQLYICEIDPLLGAESNGNDRKERMDVQIAEAKDVGPGESPPASIDKGDVNIQGDDLSKISTAVHHGERQMLPLPNDTPFVRQFVETLSNTGVEMKEVRIWRRAKDLASIRLVLDSLDDSLSGEAQLKQALVKSFFSVSSPGVVGMGGDEKLIDSLNIAADSLESVVNAGEGSTENELVWQRRVDALGDKGRLSVSDQDEGDGKNGNAGEANTLDTPSSALPTDPESRYPSTLELNDTKGVAIQKCVVIDKDRVFEEDAGPWNNGGDADDESDQPHEYYSYSRSR